MATTCDWCADGKGPPGLPVGQHLRLAVSDVHAWQETLRERDGGSCTSGR